MKILKLTAFAILILSSASIANAFGYFKNPDMYDFMGMSGFGIFLGLGLVAALAGIFLFVFWLLMLIDCLKRDFRKDIEKVVWVLVLVFLHLLGALVYYFVVKINDKKIVRKKK